MTSDRQAEGVGCRWTTKLPSYLLYPALRRGANQRGQGGQCENLTEGESWASGQGERRGKEDKDKSLSVATMPEKKKTSHDRPRGAWHWRFSWRAAGHHSIGLSFSRKGATNLVSLQQLTNLLTRVLSCFSFLFPIERPDRP